MRLRLLLVAVALAAASALVVWRGPSWELFGEAFAAVAWGWVAAAVALNFASIGARALAWQTVIERAVPEPRPRFRSVFSAFSIGMLGNAVLPGRIGEIARVAVLSRRIPRSGAWATLLGTVFAHRVFDVVAVVALALFVVASTDIPAWALTSLVALVAVGVALLGIGVASARQHHLALPAGIGRLRRLVAAAREGLGVMRSPLGTAVAVALQAAAWTFQLFAVWAAMRAFGIDEPLAAAGLVLLLMNVAGLFPLWPGNVGLVQAAVALPLVAYGIAYAHGFAFGIGLQAIEASVGVGLGLVFLAREGVSFATLKQLQHEPPEATALEPDPRAARARVPG